MQMFSALVSCNKAKGESKMSDNDLIEVYKQHSVSKDKYVYFLLAIVASAIAFSVNKTTNVKLNILDLPLLFAVSFWGLSFYFGCKYIHWAQAAMHSNYSLLQLKSGEHPDQPTNEASIQGALFGLTKALASNAKNTGVAINKQFTYAVLGGTLFLIWHAIKIYMFSTSS